MDLTPLRHRYSEDRRSFLRIDDQEENSWKEQFRSDEIGDGCRVGVVDCRVTDDQTHMVEGPPYIQCQLVSAGLWALRGRKRPEF